MEGGRGRAPGRRPSLSPRLAGGREGGSWRRRPAVFTAPGAAGGVLPAPGEGELALQPGLQPDTKGSGDIATYKSRLTPPTPTCTAALEMHTREPLGTYSADIYIYNRERTIQHGVPAQ